MFTESGSDSFTCLASDFFERRVRVDIVASAFVSSSGAGMSPIGSGSARICTFLVGLVDRDGAPPPFASVSSSVSLELITTCLGRFDVTSTSFSCSSFGSEAELSLPAPVFSGWITSESSCAEITGVSGIDSVV